MGLLTKSTTRITVGINGSFTEQKPASFPERVVMLNRIHCALLLIGSLCAASADAERPNILFISVDDMNCDSVGVFGCQLDGTTPHIDQLASEGVRFRYAHVQVGNCMPCRNVLFSGRYPHNNRVEGFYQVKDPDYPVLCELMQGGGYFAAIRGKVSHSTPYLPFAWDLVLDTVDGEKQHPKNVESYYQSTKLGIGAASRAGKPFCLLVNVSDPHKPFYAMGKKGEVVDDSNVPSRIYKADEVPIPGFLFDHPDVRRELAHYYSSVRRADDCVGATLRALKESGQSENTVIVFLSDHGMPLPFAKTALYHHSTRTPWIVKWPGVTKANHEDTHHMISGVDLLPTLLDIADIKYPEGLEGRSIVPLLQGKTQNGRDLVFKEYNENSGGHRNPMRGVQGRRFGYLFNPWVDGTRTFKTATMGTMSYRTMQQLASTDQQIAKRLDVFQHGELEQFYDYEEDPDALNNLINDPQYQNEIAQHRRALEEWMIRSGDHALTAFRNRDDPEALNSYMAEVTAQSEARRAARRREKTNPAGQQKKSNKLISLELPESLSVGKSSVKVNYQLPPRLKTQNLHVTIKQANGRRVDRKVIEITGKGDVGIVFDLPAALAGRNVRLAAFVGADYEHHLQHVVSKPVKVVSDE